MTKYEIEKLLRQYGFKMKPGSKHDIWTKNGFPLITVPRHRGDIPKGTVKNILKAAGFGSILVFALKSGYLIAAELVAEEVKNHLDDNAAKLEDNVLEYFINRLGSHLCKFLLLIPKGINDALSVHVDINDPMSFLKLPVNMIDNFFKAEGYADSIVNDWKNLQEWFINTIGNEKNELVKKQAREYFDAGINASKKPTNTAAQPALPKKKYTAQKNWSDYNKKMKMRGDITIWLSPDVIEQWMIADRQDCVCKSCILLRGSF